MDGITLLRYAHIFRNRSSGGSEQYLRQLNDGLLASNRMTILQMHLVSANSNSSAMKVEVEKRGQGQIVWIPVCVQSEKRSLRSFPRRLRLLAALSDCENSAGRQGLFSMIQKAIANSGGHLRYSEMILSESLCYYLDRYNVDLIVFHWLSYDVGTLISHAATRRIPYAIVHHFDNNRLNARQTRKWLTGAAAIGGVSNRQVPPHLKSKYVNLSDAVDFDFFSPARATRVKRPEGFVVFLPSRIIEGKGHVALLLAVQRLSETGVKVSVVFAGAIESEPLMAQLEAIAALGGIGDNMVCLGELTSEELRNWYAECDIVVLPSSSEGLGRVLLEAQAMGKPVIAYESGGMPDAVIANQTGFLVKPEDGDELSERLKYLLDNPAERSGMGKAGRIFISETFSISALITRHEKFYSMALSSSSHVV